MTSVTVLVEEHPELNNPLGRARGRVDAAETFLVEQSGTVARLEKKVADAEEHAAMCRVQLDEARSEMVLLSDELVAARQALANLESE